MAIYFDEEGNFVDEGNPTAVDPTHPDNVDDPRWRYLRTAWIRAHAETERRSSSKDEG